MTKERLDHYSILDVPADAPAARIRRAFRARILEVHPDKCGSPVDADRLRRVMRAFEVLSNPDLREDYDRKLSIRKKAQGGKGTIPHITESNRPLGRARAILYLLVNGRADEALQRLHALADDPIDFLAAHLEHGEFVDLAFLLGEILEDRKVYTEGLVWFQEIIRRDGKRRRRRPCYPEVLERAKRILIHRLHGNTDPRVSLEYLRRAEELGLTRLERVDVLKRRAQCYLDMEMKVEAARHLKIALGLQPNVRGIQRLQEALGEYL